MDLKSWNKNNPNTYEILNIFEEHCFLCKRPTACVADLSEHHPTLGMTLDKYRVTADIQLANKFCRAPGPTLEWENYCFHFPSLKKTWILKWDSRIAKNGEKSVRARRWLLLLDGGVCPWCPPPIHQGIWQQRGAGLFQGLFWSPTSLYRNKVLKTSAILLQSPSNLQSDNW